MDAHATPFLSIFEKKLRLEVPLFQRQYVWNLEQQWKPLWEDISLKFTEALDKRKDAPPHFLGAIVLDQKMTPTTYVEKRQVIDGQQRLITFQIFLSVLRDFCKIQDFEGLSLEVDSFILNKGMMADRSVEQFKVWPTQLDRNQFSDIITTGSKQALEEKYPLVYRKYARKPEPRPRMMEAYLFFYNEISEFFLGSDSEKPIIAADQPLVSRLEACFQVLKNALQIVVIDLDKDDDAQVIFETLNARGEPLLPADLIRNFIFLRIARKGESQDELYEEYWRRFDDEFWHQKIKQGRLLRPRSDIFLQHFLASHQATDIPVSHLFVEYKYWIDKKHPFNAIRDELATLANQREAFRRLIEPRKGDPLFRLAMFLNAFDISTVYPVILLLLENKLSDTDLNEIGVMLESYILRRAVCNFTTKNYNRIFLGLTRSLQQEISKGRSLTPENVRNYLANLTGESVEWPKNEVFFDAWQNKPAYLLGNSKLVYILQRLNGIYFTGKNENITIDGPLTIEHIMPQKWRDNWPLPDGSKGLTFTELLERKEGDPLVDLTNRRNAVLQTIGNLTILTQPLNAAVSNSAWEHKKPELLQASLLPINQQLHAYDKWDEETIEKRGKEFFEKVKEIWPEPSASGNK